MLLKCTGENCERLLSVSRIPGGNPVVAQSPELVTADFLLCADCGAGLCDRCLAGKTGLFSQPQCAVCGGEMRKPDIAKLLPPPGRRPAPPPDDGFLRHFDEARALQKAGRNAEALAEFEQAAAIRPQEPIVEVGRATTLWQLGRLEEALAAFDRLARHRDDDPQLHCFRAEILRSLRRDDDAVAAYQLALAIDPAVLDDDLRAAKFTASRLMGAERFGEAEPVMRRLAAGGDVTAVLNIGYLCARTDRMGEAQQWYQRAADLGDPDAIEFLRSNPFGGQSEEQGRKGRRWGRKG
ncbi:tetratricopeptide repeat protein [Catenulispora pinisilvae]|uniref:tetratricopeptide repeat protein n=1 Tax=Catenulispora pinisilvae TaxID=2705253 RepID=UPI0018911535|nr:tetratricopeptide repeat protein [Catenulispora pinisilvae]